MLFRRAVLYGLLGIYIHIYIRINCHIVLNCIDVPMFQAFAQLRYIHCHAVATIIMNSLCCNILTQNSQLIQTKITQQKDNIISTFEDYVTTLNCTYNYKV